MLLYGMIQMPAMDKLVSSVKEQVVMMVVEQGKRAIKFNIRMNLPSNLKQRLRTTLARENQL